MTRANYGSGPSASPRRGRRALFVRREAVESSRIEGAQSSLEDVLVFALDPHRRDLPGDVTEVVSYLRAMNYGLNRLATLPLSLRLIREIHAELLRDMRGAERSPRQFRTSRNWIGPAGRPLARDSFVPPPAHELGPALVDLERFLHDASLPALLQCGLAHAQFETIHPILDGNGRVGRLLIAFLLVHRGVLHRPLLYVSSYLKRHRTEYYDRLMAIRERGDWEGWLRFFLRGVAETEEDAATTARATVRLREEHRAVLQTHGLGPNETRLLDLLSQQPLVTIGLVQERLGVTDVTAGRAIERLAALGLLVELTGMRCNRVWRYEPSWRLVRVAPRPVVSGPEPEGGRRHSSARRNRRRSPSGIRRI